MSSLPPNQRDSLAALAAESMRGSAGLPVGVQVMSPPWRDELCIYTMNEVEADIRFSAKPAICTAH